MQTENRHVVSRRFHLPKLSGRRLFDIYLRSVVLVADHDLWRPVPPARHIRLGQGDLGDRADRVLVYWDIHISDHATPRDGGTATAAGSAGSRRASPSGRLQRGRRDRQAGTPEEFELDFQRRISAAA